MNMEVHVSATLFHFQVSPFDCRGLLDPEKQSLRPDEQFLEWFSGVVKSECPSLASILSLTSTEMEEVEKNRKQLS